MAKPETLASSTVDKAIIFNMGVILGLCDPRMTIVPWEGQGSQTRSCILVIRAVEQYIGNDAAGDRYQHEMAAILHPFITMRWLAQMVMAPITNYAAAAGVTLAMLPVMRLGHLLVLRLHVLLLYWLHMLLVLAVIMPRI